MPTSRQSTKDNLTFQRRHFEFIAETIAKIQAPGAHYEAAVAFADALKATNPNFDRKRFLEAAGLEG